MFRAPRALPCFELLAMSAVVVALPFLTPRTIAPLLFTEFFRVPPLPSADFLIHASLAIAAMSITFAFIPIEITERLVLPAIGTVFHFLLEDSGVR